MKFVHMLMWAALAAAPVSIATAAPAADADAPSPAAAVSMLQSGLGIVADGRDRTGDGVLVRAVTPGGAAERLGVRPGDRLVSINGQPLGNAAAPHALLDRLADSSGGEVRLELLRDGRTVALAGSVGQSGDAPAVAQAAVEGCGWVSTVGVPPRVSRNIFDAVITQINGQSTPLEVQNRYRVPAGRNVLVVQEFIDRHRISMADVQRIHRMQRRESARAYKVLVVDVEPGVRYSVGAELLEDRLDPQGIRENAYWQPVVWESRPEACN